MMTPLKMCMDACTQNGKRAIKPKQQKVKCETEKMQITDPSTFYVLIFASSLIKSRLYKASMPIHASHNEEILKKKSNSTCIGDCQIYQDILTHLQSGAFRRLCQHLRERSNEVQNIDLMALSGFCRNCLAKVCDK